MFQSKRHIALFLAIASSSLALVSCSSTFANTSQEVSSDRTITTATPLQLSAMSTGFQHQLHVVGNNGKSETITTTNDETDGVVITNTRGKRAHIGGSFSLASPFITSSPQGPILTLALFDNNSQQLVIKNLDALTLSPTARREYAQPVNGSEAMCAGMVDNTMQIINIDATGMLNQYLLIDESLVDLRRFAFGPGIKQCAVSSQANSIYLADEYAGVWQVDALSESEVSRTLIFSEPDIAVEGVSVLVSEDIERMSGATQLSELVAWVSPDANTLWLKSECSEYNLELSATLDAKPYVVSPETVHLSFDKQGDTLRYFVAVDDDNSNTLFKAQLPFNTNDLQCKNTEKLYDNHKVVYLSATAQTQPVDNYGDAADDPAIWVNSNAPHQSLIIGTDKKGALNSYDLQGTLVQSLALGRVNNVDVGYQVALANTNNTEDAAETIDIAIASNRTSNSLSVVSIDKEGTLSLLGDIATNLTDVYGMCMFVASGQAHVLVNDTSGDFERYAIRVQGNGNVSGELIQTFSLPSQPEGCVIDAELNMAYLGEEAAGIWQLDLNTNHGVPVFSTPIESPVEADIEGLALFNVDNMRYVIASSQGNNAYAVYRALETKTQSKKGPLQYIGLIRIDANLTRYIDGVSETDGLEITNANLGGQYADGLWVVQDGRNVLPSTRQNFKLISGKHLATAIRQLRAAE